MYEVSKTLITIIQLEFDLVELHYNPNLKYKPYLVRVYNYNNSDPEELRLEIEEADDLYNTLKKHKLL